MQSLLFLLFFLILASPGSNASTSILAKFGILEGPGSSKVETLEVSPSPNPLPSASPNPSPLSSHQGEKLSPHVAPVPAADSPKARLNRTDEPCKVSSNRCRDQRSMIACLVHSASAQLELCLVVQNSGEDTLNVNVSGLPVNLEVKIPQHQVEKIKISSFPRSGALIVLNAGNGDCAIHIAGEASEGNVPNLFPSYTARATPTNGVYLSFFAALIIGGTWACCKLRKRAAHFDGVPYQELEMGQPESLPVDNVEATQGWDEGWNEEWDEENAAKPPTENQVGNAKENGLSSRSANAGGWEDDWGD